MKKKSSLSLLLFVLAIGLPTAVLGILGISSINNEIQFAETKYRTQLESNKARVLNYLTAQNDLFLSQTRRYLLRLADLEPTISHLTNTELPELPIPVQGVFIFHESQLIFPFINKSRFALEELESYMEPFEKRLYQIEMQGNITRTHLQIRLQRNRNTSLDPRAKRFNQLGLVRTYLLTNQFDKALRQIRYMEFDQYWRDSEVDFQPLLWHLEYEIYRRTQKWNRAIIHVQRVLTKALNNQWNETEIQVLDYMIEDALSIEGLKPIERNQFFRIHQNLQKLLIHYKSYTDHFKMINTFSLLLPYSPQAQFHEFQKFLICEIPLHSGKNRKRAFILFNRNDLYEHYLKNLLLDKEPLKSTPIQIKGFSMSFENLDKQSFKKVHDIFQFPPQFPFQELRIFRHPESYVQKGANKRATLLYSLLCFSVFIIIMSLTIGIKTLRKERKLLEMKSNFLSSITHELKTPLTSIKMFAEMIHQGRVKQLEKAQEISGLINQESDRLDLLISDILNYSRLEKGDAVLQLKNLSLSELSHQVARRLEVIAKQKKHHLIIEIEPDLFIHGDLRSLESLIQNLIDNAIKYSPEPSTIKIQLSEKNHSVALTVIDQGIGIAKTDIHRIFDAFYRAGDEMTRETKGSGIGLAIVKKVADLHRASVHIDSNLGKGTQIQILFPKEKNDG